MATSGKVLVCAAGVLLAAGAGLPAWGQEGGKVEGVKREGGGGAASGRGERAGPNAALGYYGVWTTWNESDLKIVTELSSDIEFGKPLPQKLHDAVVASKESVARLLRTAAMKRCDFELDYREGFNLLLPHLSKMRGSARLLRADAVRLMNEGKADEAAERYAAMIGIGRHAAHDRVLISSLVGIAVVSLTHADLVEGGGAARLTREGRALVVAALDRIGTVDGYNLKLAIENERIMAMDGTIGRYVGADAGRRFIDEVVAPIAGPSNLDKAELDLVRGYDGAALRDEAAKMEPFYTRAVQAWDSPNVMDTLKKLDFQARTGEFGVLGKHLLPALGKCRQSQEQVGKTMLAIRKALSDADAAEDAAKKGGVVKP